MTPPVPDAAGVLALGVVVLGHAIARRRRRRSARRSVDTYLRLVLADLAEPPRPHRRPHLALADQAEPPRLPRRPHLAFADRAVPEHPSPPRAPLTRPSPPPRVGALARVEQP